MNRWRSPTAERLFRNDPRLDVRSAGVSAGATRRLGAGDLRWADVLMVMERDHRRSIRERFPDLELPPIVVLDVPDDYQFMDPELQELLRRQIGPELELRLGNDGPARDVPGPK